MLLGGFIAFTEFVASSTVDEQMLWAVLGLTSFVAPYAVCQAIQNIRNNMIDMAEDD